LVSAAAETFDLAVARRGPWRQAVGRFRRRPLGIVALAVFAVLCLVGALAGVLAPYPAGREFIELIQKPQPPLTAHHLLGTDVLGRDFLTQTLFAIRQTTLSALVCAAASTAIGVVVGALAGFYGGWLDALVMWATGVVVAVPAIAVLAIILVWSRFPVTPLGDGLWLTTLLWTGPARVVRASVVSLRAREYIEAAHASGASSLRILARHLLPNSSGPIVVAATSLVGQAIVIVATVDYLGWAFNEAERPTLGGLVADGTRSTDLLTGPVPLSAVWWLYALPSALLVVLLMSVAFLGDALDDALNPA
jgi:ABC-type dipeptide/oligopeptide/nickel transport system permease subunit